MKTIAAILKDFEKQWVVQHQGDSGAGGNTPQEPVYEIQTYGYEDEFKHWLSEALQTAERRGEERERERFLHLLIGEEMVLPSPDTPFGRGANKGRATLIESLRASLKPTSEKENK